MQYEVSHWQICIDLSKFTGLRVICCCDLMFSLSVVVILSHRQKSRDASRSVRLNDVVVGGIGCRQV